MISLRPKPRTEPILLPVDEAYAFDYLAILAVKQQQGLNVSADIERVEKELRRQLPNYDEVVASPEFDRMIKVNKEVFDAIELAHEDKISASAVQEANYNRFLAKLDLQFEYWPNKAVTEQKTALVNRKTRA